MGGKSDANPSKSSTPHKVACKSAVSNPRLIALLLALATLAVYLPVARHDFICYDDDLYVTNNLIVQHGLTLSGIRWAFTTFHCANWHPLTWLSHMTDCELFGLNPGAHHLANAMFHALNSALVFILLWRLTRLVRPAALVAALFAWHPLHVESVAWAAERKDVLSTFFALLALLSYAHFAQKNCRRSFWLALVFFGLGLLAKPMLVTLPFVLLLLDFWPLNRIPAPGFKFGDFKPLMLEKIPFFALTVLSCVVTFIAQRAGHAVNSLEQVPLLYRLENAPTSAAHYLLKIFWPTGLFINYPITPIPGPIAALAIAVLVVITVAVWLARDRSRCWLMGWLWFLGMLVPVIGLVQVGDAAMADRYSYLPSVGIFMAIIFGLQEWCGRHPGVGRLIMPGLWLAPAACILLTETQLSYWRNTETLFRHALVVTKDNDVAHDCLGQTYEQQGRNSEAVAEYREAIRLNPTHYQLHLAIGNLLEKSGQPAEALEEFRLCLARNPEVPALHNAAGSALAAEGNLNEALPEFAEAERLDPHYAEPHLELAKIYFGKSKDKEATDELLAAARAQPYDVKTLTATARYLAANADDSARDGQSALALALKANDLSGNSQPEVFDVLGMAFATTGDFSNAVICAQNALEFATIANLKDPAPLRQRLELYQNRQPWRESFRSTNAPVAK